MELLLILCIALSQVNTCEGTRETGTYFHHENKIYASYSSWLLVFNFEWKPYGSNIRRVQNGMSDFSEKFSELSKQPVLSTLPEQTQLLTLDLRSRLYSLFQSEHQMFQRSMVKVKSTYDNLRSVTTTQKQDRNKRALLPFVGNLASSLFGVATKSDIRQINEGLQRIRNTEKTVAHLLQDSLSVINKTNQDVQINRKTINQLIKNSDILKEKLQNVFDEVTTKLQYTHTALELHSAFHVLMTALDSLTEMLGRLSSQISDLNKGTLPYDLVPPQVMRNLLTDIQEHLPPTLALPYPVGQVSMYYKTLPAVLVPGRNKFHVLTSIPLAHTNAEYDLYKVVQVPVPLQVEKALMYEVEANFLGVTPDKSSYTLLTDFEAAQCQHDSFDYCPLSNPSLDSDLNPSCIMSLFGQQSDLIKANCLPREVPVPVAPVLRHIINGKWLSSSRNKYSIEMSCDLKVSKISVPQGVSVVELQQGCIAYTSFFRLPPYFHQQSETVLGKSFKVLLDFPLALENFSNPTVFPDLQTLDLLPELDTSQPALNTMRSLIESMLNQLNKDTMNNGSKWSYTATAMSIGAIVLSVCIILFMYYRKMCFQCKIWYLNKGSQRETAVKRCPRNKDGPGTAIEMEPLDKSSELQLPEDPAMSTQPAKKNETFVFDFTKNGAK